MSRQLLILRHAKSSWGGDAPTDFERSLNKRGKHDAPRMGAWLCQQGCIPEYVVSSPAKRAKQTACKVCEALSFDTAGIRWEPRVYEASLGTLLQVLADCPDTAKTVLLVGHNPGLEFLVESLLGENTPSTDDGKLLPTATVARLAMPDDWSQLEMGRARLISITRPRSL